MNLEALSRLDPDHILIADVIEIFQFRFMPRWRTRLILNTCVRRGEFGRNADGSFRLLTAANQPQHQSTADHQPGEGPGQPAPHIGLLQFDAQDQDHHADHSDSTD